jgi:death on curing protein
VSALEPVFLTLDDVYALHERQLGRFGGGAGLRDAGLLASAIAQPHASFGGAFAHEGLVAMAAAYLFHVVSNHPFLDGNKRVGLLCALVFLHVNGVRVVRGSEALYDLTMAVAQGQLDKAAVTARLAEIVQ